MLLVALAWGCGGAVESQVLGQPGTDEAPGTGPDDPPIGVLPPAALTLEGSFDLSFASVTATMPAGGPSPPSVKPPSLTTKARLDIAPNEAGGYDAVLTGRWGSPAAYRVAVTDDALTLTGEGTIRSASAQASFGATDTWKSLTLPRDASGDLTGEVRGTGEEWIGAGDVVWQAQLSGTGALVKDATSPELRAAVVGIGPQDRLLPWEPIRVAAAEPVNRSGVEQTALDGDEPGPALRWDAPDPKAPSWAGTASFTAHVDDWGAVGGRAWTVANPGAPVRDRVGQASGALAQPVKFLSLAGPTSLVGFDSDIIEVSPWGETAMYGGGLAGTDDPRCESGGCFRIGPVTLGACSVQRAGFAAQLERLAAGHVSLRYRVLAATQSGGGAPLIVGDMLTLELAARGGAVADHGVYAYETKLTALGAPIDGMTHATPWTTLDAPAPAGSGPIGVAVLASGSYAVRGGCGGPPPPPVTFEILVEDVTSH